MTITIISISLVSGIYFVKFFCFASHLKQVQAERLSSSDKKIIQFTITNTFFFNQIIKNKRRKQSINL